MTITETVIGHTRPHTEAGLSIIHGPAHSIAKLSGDLDIATTPALREKLTALLKPGIELLILDLSEVSFCDAVGLAVLIGTQRRAAPLGITLCLAAPRPQVTKLLVVTGLDRVSRSCPPSVFLTGSHMGTGGGRDRGRGDQIPGDPPPEAAMEVQ